MSRSLVRTTLALALVVSTACSESLAPDDIVGTYDATTMVFTSVADPNTTADVLAMGYTFTIQFNANGTLSTAFTLGGSTDTDSGTYMIDGSNFTLTIGGDPSTGTISKSGDRLTIMLMTGVEFDFNDDGTDEPATLRLVVERL